jgi:uncharacterized Fe-S cluster-containing MiaB family protein
MFETTFVEKIKAYILFSIIFFSENRAVYDIMWKNMVGARQVTGNNMTYALCMPDNYGKNTDTH